MTEVPQNSGAYAAKADGCTDGDGEVMALPSKDDIM